MWPPAPHRTRSAGLPRRWRLLILTWPSPARCPDRATAPRTTPSKTSGNRISAAPPHWLVGHDVLDRLALRDGDGILERGLLQTIARGGPLQHPLYHRRRSEEQ